MKTRSLALVLATSLVSSAPLLYADEIIDQIEMGRQAYEAGELRQAKDELQYAIAQIQELLDNQYVKLMPEPLPGWVGEPAQAQTAGMAMMGGGTQLSRAYRNNATGESVELSLVADSPFLQAMSMMLSNPMMMRSEPGTKLYRLGKHRGMIKNPPGSDRWEISLMLANRILVQVQGDGLKDQSPAEAYLKALDLDAVQQAFGM